MATVACWFRDRIVAVKLQFYWMLPQTSPSLSFTQIGAPQTQDSHSDMTVSYDGFDKLSHWHLGDASLTHWGRVTHICVGNLTIIGPDHGLSPGRRQAIIWTNAGILLIGPWGTNFSEILIGIQTFSSKKMHLKMSSAKWRPFCLGLNVLIRKLQFSNGFYRMTAVGFAVKLLSCEWHSYSGMRSQYWVR